MASDSDEDEDPTENSFTSQRKYVIIVALIDQILSILIAWENFQDENFFVKNPVTMAQKVLMYSSELSTLVLIYKLIWATVAIVSSIVSDDCTWIPHVLLYVCISYILVGGLFGFTFGASYYHIEGLPQQLLTKKTMTLVVEVVMPAVVHTIIISVIELISSSSSPHSRRSQTQQRRRINVGKGMQ